MSRTVNNSTIARNEPLKRGPWNSDRRPTDEPLRTSTLKKKGKKGRAWDSIRARELKPQFAAMGVTTCEARFKDCMVDDGLGFAHALKRRHIQTDADMRNVALLCNNCHDKLELQGEARMRRQIEKIIEQRAFGLAALEAA